MSDNPPAEAPAASLRWVLVVVALTTMLAPLNSTMIGVALPQITESFGVDLAQSGWLVIAYLVVMASLQPVAGKLGDRLGRRRMILFGLVYFALASLGAATATDLTSLLVFRVQQAIAGALALPNGMALMRQVVPAEERGRRFGLVGSAVVLAAAAGPPLGGVLIELTDWRGIFYINLLFIAPALLLGFWVLPRQTSQEQRRPFDLLGAVLLLLVLVSAAGMATAKIANGAFVLLGWCLLGAVAVFFVRHEWHHADPVLQPRLFRSRTFTAVNAAISLSNLAMYTTFLAIPLLLDQRPGWNSAKAGLVLTALWAPTVVFTPLGGRLADQWGRRWPVSIGLALLAVGLAMLLGLSEAIEKTILFASLILAGSGLGLSHAGMQTAAVEAVPRQDAGVASGVFSTSRYIGSIIGSSLLPLLFVSGSGIAGFSRVLLLVSAAAAAALLVSFGIEHRPRSADSAN